MALEIGFPALRSALQKTVSTLIGFEKVLRTFDGERIVVRVNVKPTIVDESADGNAVLEPVDLNAFLEIHLAGHLSRLAQSESLI